MKFIPALITLGLFLFMVGIFVQAYSGRSLVMVVYGILILPMLWICINILRD